MILHNMVRPIIQSLLFYLGRCRNGDPPPKLGHPCPHDIHVHADDACSDTTAVYWTDPTASVANEDCETAQ